MVFYLTKDYQIIGEVNIHTSMIPGTTYQLEGTGGGVKVRDSADDLTSGDVDPESDISFKPGDVNQTNGVISTTQNSYYHFERYADIWHMSSTDFNNSVFNGIAGGSDKNHELFTSANEFDKATARGDQGSKDMVVNRAPFTTSFNTSTIGTALYLQSWGNTTRGQNASYTVTFTTLHSNADQAELAAGNYNGAFSGVYAIINSYQDGWKNLQGELVGQEVYNLKIDNGSGSIDSTRPSELTSESTSESTSTSESASLSTVQSQSMSTGASLSTVQSESMLTSASMSGSLSTSTSMSASMSASLASDSTSTSGSHKFDSDSTIESQSISLSQSLSAAVSASLSTSTSQSASSSIKGLHNYASEEIDFTFTAATTYQVDDKQNQFVVHLRHKTQATSRTKTVTQTITYHLPDGTTKVVPRTLTFTQGGTTDLATGETTWDANWTQTQTLAAVASPIYNGYTASAAMAGATQITVTTPTWTTNLDQQIDVYYTLTTTRIPIYYYDENGHPIADPIIVDGNGATNFDEYHKVITGYQFERREIKGADGCLTEVIFYYLKTTNGGEITPPVQPVQPVGPSQPAQPTAPSQPTPTSSGQGTPTAEQELPQTGNQTSETSVLGLTLLGVLGLLGLSKRKRKE